MNLSEREVTRNRRCLGVRIPPRPPYVIPAHFSEIVNFGLWMRKEGYRESTCYYAVRSLKRLDRRCNIIEPEAVKRFLANSSWSEGGKKRITEEVDRFYRYLGLKWEKPKYEKIDLLPFIPREEEVDALVAGLYNRTVEATLVP